MTENRRHNTGYISIELIGGMAIATMLTTGLIAWQQTAMDDMRGQQAAQHHKQVVESAQKYIKANYLTIKGSTSATTPARVTVAMLKAAPGNYLDASFPVTNAYGQTPCVLILEPATDRLSTLVVTEGGQAIEDKDLGYIAGLTGKGGGSVTAAAPTVATGAYGAFSTALAPYNTLNCSGTTVGAGHLANALYFDGDGDLLADYLYRNAVPGHPEANEMGTPLVFTTVQTVGDPCSPGAIGRDNTGAVVSCQGGTWKNQSSGVSSWKDPVLAFANLPATGNNPGDVRMTTSTGRAFMWSGATWSALAVDQNGNLLVPAELTVNGTATVNGTISAGGRITGAGVTSNGHINTQTDDWALLGHNSAGANNAAAQSSVGSAYLNDAYFRSVGKWASQILSASQLNSGIPGSVCNANVYCQRATAVITGGSWKCSGTVLAVSGWLEKSVTWNGSKYVWMYDAGTPCWPAYSFVFAN